MDLKYFTISLLTNIFTSIGLLYSFSKISNISLKITVKNILIILLSCIILCFNNYYNVVTFRVFLALLITFIRELITFKINIKDTFIITIILSILSILIEFATLPLMAIKVSSITIFNDELILKMLYSILNNFILIMFIKNKRITNFLKKIKFVVHNFMSFYTISIFLICFINIILYFFAYDMSNIQLTIVIIISILLLLICLKTIINAKISNNLLLEKNKALKDEHKAYANTIDECKELKHNLKNELYSLKIKLPKEEQTTINTIITKYNTNYEWINTLNDIPEGLQGLIYLKINEAKVKKIKIFLNTKTSLQSSEKDYLDLSIILGILIDNAIEASELSKSKTIVINITESSNFTNIEIINKYINNINTSEIGKKNYSTKEVKSGLGLNFIKNLSKPNIKVKFKIINDLFITNLEYSNKNK